MANLLSAHTRTNAGPVVKEVVKQFTLSPSLSWHHFTWGSFHWLRQHWLAVQLANEVVHPLPSIAVDAVAVAEAAVPSPPVQLVT